MPSSSEIQRNLIQRVNVGDSLTRAAARYPDAPALASGNSIEFLVTYYACAKLGVVCVPLNLGWRGDEVGYVLGHSGSRGIVVEGQLLPALGEALPKCDGV